MARRSAEEIRGFEFDWLATDAAGQVALFSTAGGGYAPDAFLEDTEAHDEAIAAIVSAPSSTTAREAPIVQEGLTNTWRIVAERGLFAFDADAHGGGYRLVAIPEKAAVLGDLPVEAVVVAKRIKLGNLVFGRAPVIQADALESGA